MSFCFSVLPEKVGVARGCVLTLSQTQIMFSCLSVSVSSPSRWAWPGGVSLLCHKPKFFHVFLFQCPPREGGRGQGVCPYFVTNPNNVFMSICFSVLRSRWAWPGGVSFPCHKPKQCFHVFLFQCPPDQVGVARGCVIALSPAQIMFSCLSVSVSSQAGGCGRGCVFLCHQPK